MKNLAICLAALALTSCGGIYQEARESVIDDNASLIAPRGCYHDRYDMTITCYKGEGVGVVIAHRFTEEEYDQLGGFFGPSNKVIDGLFAKLAGCERKGDTYTCDKELSTRFRTAATEEGGEYRALADGRHYYRW